ncbi:Alkaline nuclease [Caprine alphaherpesvirus 1]|uniref:Alkaline nuclease n=1 Tax=Caprine alphaherpesvirus 1 TaxID=39944 RepID=A0AAE6D051_9ALPH|nr:Alkaline nuclease [Caprine alphaherpesvirus 1]QBM10889.1 Alkaline nuclease [Caprine alphaherpesvirus 1]
MDVGGAPPAKRARFELDSARAALERLPEALLASSMRDFLAAGPEGPAGGEAAAPRDAVAWRAAYVRHVLAGAGVSPAPRDARALFLAVEAATRGQAACDLWWLLRRSLATASAIRWTAGGPRPLVCLGPGAPEERDTPATLFGRSNEPLARALVRACCVPAADLPTPDGLADAPAAEAVFVFDAPAAGGGGAAADAGPSAEHACGLLIDVRTGALGASIDMLVCDRDARGELAPHPAHSALGLFEIKCRAKYAFDPDDGGATARAHAALLAARSAAALRAFLRSVCRPGVERCPPDGCPGTAEALASCAAAWAAGGGSAAQARRCPDFDQRHLALNREVTSRVWLFNEPDPGTGAIGLATWDSGAAALEVPLFANPRHANFKQILVQSYVLSGYFPERAVSPHLVTFVGRQQRARERGRLTVCAAAGGCAVPRECAVPVLLIVTPVVLDLERARAALEQPARDAFWLAAEAAWGSRRRAAGAAATGS